MSTFRLADMSPETLTELAELATRRASAASAAALEYGEKNRDAATDKARTFWSGEVERAQDRAADWLALNFAARAELHVSAVNAEPRCCCCDAPGTFRITCPTDASGPAGTVYCDGCAGSTCADMERI